MTILLGRAAEPYAGNPADASAIAVTSPAADAQTAAMQHAIHSPIVTRLARSLGRLTQVIVARSSIWFVRMRTRRRLGDLSTHLLADIGLDEWDRDREIAKWFWEA